MSGYRQEAEQVLRELGKSAEDVIIDFLARLLAHTRARLVKKYDYQESDWVDLVVTVPAIWDTRARIMERAIRRAASVSNLGHGSDVFLVSEPEAAAAFISEIHASTFEFDLQASRSDGRLKYAVLLLTA